MGLKNPAGDVTLIELADWLWNGPQKTHARIDESLKRFQRAASEKALREAADIARLYSLHSLSGTEDQKNWALKIKESIESLIEKDKL